MTYFSPELFIKGSNNIFTFGSNMAGRHGAGAAKFAIEHCGAIYGQGFGLQGNAYALPTKNEFIRTMPLEQIALYVHEFLTFAKANPQLAFYVTAVGTGLAGYSDLQIAPMFANAPVNCVLPEKWKILENKDIILLDKE